MVLNPKVGKRLVGAGAMVVEGEVLEILVRGVLLLWCLLSTQFLHCFHITSQQYEICNASVAHKR